MTSSQSENPDAVHLSYRDAGVDIDAGDRLIENIKPYAKCTMRPEVLAGIGGFGALFEISKKYRNPVLVSGTDGVGTKLKLAFQLNQHDGVGMNPEGFGQVALFSPQHRLRYAHGLQKLGAGGA